MRNSRKRRRRTGHTVFAPGRSVHCVENLEKRTLLSAAIAAFNPRQDFFTGNSPVALAIADVNRDGKPDLLVANNTDGTVGVLLGDGTGSFSNQQTFACGPNPFAVAVADVNGDGKPDLIVANYTSSHVSVLLGNGDGTFQPPLSFAAGNGPIALATADMNGDGRQDILVANYSSGTVSLLDGNGDGTFQPQQTFAAGTHPISIAAADLNGDGKLDLAVANYTVTNGTVSVLLGAGTGSFSARQTFAVGAKPRDLAVADLNRDGKPDLAVVNKTDGTASILLSNGDGTFQTQTTFAVGASPNTIALADVNGDGKEDLVVAGGGTAYPAAAVLLGNGDGTFQLPVTFATGSNPYALAVADLNGDGRLDLATVNQRDNSVSVLLGDVPPTVLSINRTNPPGPITSDSSVTYTVTFNEPVTGVDASDFSLALNGVTATMPVVVNGSGAVYTVTVNGISGSGTLGVNLMDNGRIKDIAQNPLQPTRIVQFQTPEALPVDGNPGDVVIADINRDGIPDIISANPTNNPGTVSVMLGNADGSFRTQQTSAAGILPDRVAVSDLNGDGIPDLVVAANGPGSSFPSYVSVFLGNGDATFRAPQTFTVGYGPCSLMVADVNGDGKPDLIVASSPSRSISVLLGNGNGTFSAQQTMALPSYPSDLAVSDINGDRKLDLVTVNRIGFTGSVSIMLGNGNGTFQPQRSFAVGGGTLSLDIADINGDGRPDLLIANNPYMYSGFITMLLGNGDGTFQAPRTLAIQTPVKITTADLNGDGKSDLLVLGGGMPGSSVGIVTSLLLGNGNGTFAAPETIGTPGVDITVGDVNRDGRSDLIVAGPDESVLVYPAAPEAPVNSEPYTLVPSLDTITGGGAVDQIALTLDSDGEHIDWNLGGTTAQTAINDPNGLTVNGNGGNDVITFDYTNGTPLPKILHLNGTFTINGLQGTNPLAGTSLDIGKSTVLISYANAASDPIAAIKGYLHAGYNNGGWTGTPSATTGVITSLPAVANPNHTTAIGYADFADGQGVNTTPNTIELTYTLNGDANLDHQVNSADLQILLFNLNRPGSWDQGDFNYDGQVNSADLQELLFTLNTSLGSQAAPAQAAAATLAAAQTNETTTKTVAVAPLMPAVSSKPTLHPKVIPPHRAGPRRHR